MVFALRPCSTTAVIGRASRRARVEVSVVAVYLKRKQIAERVRGMGVRPLEKRFNQDGVRGPNMATVYSDGGHGIRAPIVFYNRCNEAAAQLKPGDFDWKAITAGGLRWFHS